jgi:hypothetical protein
MTFIFISLLYISNLNIYFVSAVLQPHVKAKWKLKIMSDAFGEDLFNVFDQNTETHVTPTDKTSSSRYFIMKNVIN